MEPIVIFEFFKNWFFNEVRLNFNESLYVTGRIFKMFSYEKDNCA